ncbi:MAG: segregation/condensation protein A [Candidatus Melainabacteria bacterium]|nr:segregation/condensation protein A [Candidatus Melainabacteria bacterium]
MTIAKVDRLLEESIKVGDALTLLKLIKMLGPKSDWVDAFLAILFLSNAGKIILEQEEFYGPVQIIRAEEMAFGQAFKVTGVDHSTPEQIQHSQQRELPPKPRKSKKAQIEIPLPTDTVNIQ